MRKPKEDSEKRAKLIDEINQVEDVLLNSYKNMQLVEEKGLLDYYAYKIKSEEAKHEYLMQKIKELEV